MIALHELPIISKLVTILMDLSPIVEAPQRNLKKNPGLCEVPKNLGLIGSAFFVYWRQTNKHPSKINLNIYIYMAVPE